jgi:Transcriptional regulator of a riboflavin/FAD biosynthetic operon
MERKYIFELIKLAQLGAFYKPILISTNFLAKELKTTQQNASLKLIRLEEEGYITRKTSRRGQEIMLTKKGRDVVLETYSGLKGIIEGKKEVIVKGIVQKGIGEGGYYISLEGYAKQFEEKLGYRPFPGTLNIKLIEPKSRGFLNNFTGIFINGFTDGKRTYGWVKCFPAIINNKLDCHVILLERTIHPRNIIEVISKYHIKKELGIKEGDIVEIKILPQ